MAVGNFTVFKRAKGQLMDGTIDLDTDVLYGTLHTSAAALSAGTDISTFASIGSEIADGNGYSTSGKTLSATAWTTGASSKEWRFDSTAIFWSANGGSIANIKFLVVRVSGGQALGFVQLSTSQFSLTDGNRLTVTPSANGWFELN